MELDFSKKISESKGLSKILAEQKTRKQINDLPDSDFAYIEPGGSKDESGRTVPRSLRHLPIMDCAHVRNALARLSQTKISAEAKASALKKIKAAAKTCGIEMSEAGLPPWLEKKKKGDDDKEDKKEEDKKEDKKEDDKEPKKKEESKGQGIQPLNNLDYEKQRVVKNSAEDEEEKDEKELDRDDKEEKKEHEKDAIKDDKKQVKDLEKDEKEDEKTLEESTAPMNCPECY